MTIPRSHGRQSRVRSRLSRGTTHQRASGSWHGPVRRYDILKEGTIALVVVSLLTILLAVLFSSPDEPPVTLQAWASAQPRGFTEVALSELDATSLTATYGPPYNHESGSVQYLFGISIQKAIGVTDPIDPAKAFVLDPLTTVTGQPALRVALSTYARASHSRQLAWDIAYSRALNKASVVGTRLVVPRGHYGPVRELLGVFLDMARSGGLDAELVAHSSFYTTNYTNPIMMLGDSITQQNSYWNKIVSAQHLQGDQWGVMNETGSWPGQPWLWLYTMWYQISPMSTSTNGDIEVLAIMTVLSLALLFLPFIPGLREIPRLIPVHRLIWREYYRDYPRSPRTPQAAGRSPPDS